MKNIIVMVAMFIIVGCNGDSKTEAQENGNSDPLSKLIQEQNKGEK